MRPNSSPKRNLLAVLTLLLVAGALPFFAFSRPSVAQVAGEALAHEETVLPGFLWADNSVTLLVGGGFELEDGEQFTTTLEHFSGWSTGDVFIFLDYNKFIGGKASWYGEIQPRLSLGKLSDTNISVPLLPHGGISVKDVLIAGTYGRGKDRQATESRLIGMGVDLDLPIFASESARFAYFMVNLYARQDIGRPFNDLHVTAAAAYEHDGGLLIDGYIDYVAGFGHQAENLQFVPQIKYDIGQFWGVPKHLYAGTEAYYWMNKFGVDSDDSDQLAASALLKMHF